MQKKQYKLYQRQSAIEVGDAERLEGATDIANQIP